VHFVTTPRGTFSIGSRSALAGSLRCALICPDLRVGPQGEALGQDNQYAGVDILEREGQNLSADLSARLPKTYGRGEELDALSRVLAGRTSAVLLGPPGVGKTAIVRKLLHYLATGRLPALAGAEVFEISTVGLCSGTRYTGQQEEKIQALLRQAKPSRLVYIPDLWNITTAGSYETHPRGIYDLMRPGIESTELVLFGEMSQGRWDKLCREHPSLERDFATVTVAETDEGETRDILWRAAGDLGHEVTFAKSAIDRVYALAKKFLPVQAFPGKGVDLLRRVAHAAEVPQKGKARVASVDVAFVEELFAQQTGLPMHMISPRKSVTYAEMRGFLGERVLGQPEAVDAVADVLALYKTGLSNPDRPAGVLLFVGPTGVGKTELAKATAEFLFGSRERMFRVDLSEYKDYHSFEKLIGDPKQNKTGILTDHVRQNPLSVVLLDEFEKGHPNLADLFLQVFDDGRLTDATGETIGFKSTLIILTSNVGSDLTESAIGFGDATREPGRGLGPRILKALEKQYRPEFLNRIDRVLVLQPLGSEAMRRIARRELAKIYKREGLLERDLLLEVDEGVIDLLLAKGFDPKYGARPLKRAIEETVVIPLARVLLEDEHRRFQLLRLARAGDRVELSFEDTESSRKLDKLERRARAPDGEGGVVHLSLAEVRVALRDIYERLARLGERIRIDELRRELSSLLQREAGPAFWEEAFGEDGIVVRRHQLTVDIRRYDDLKQRTDLVRELVDASFDEAEDSVAGELLAAFARLERKLRRAEREMIRMGSEDQADAMVWVRSVGDKPDDVQWASMLARMYAAWARDRGYEVSSTSRDGDQLLTISGPCAFGYLRGEHGGHRLISPPASRDKRRAETYLAKVDVSPASDDVSLAPRPAAEVDDPPIRTYDLWRSRGVRDRRTGHSEGDARRVLSGRLDGFLEAHVDTRETTVPLAPS
jgi:ATP-dependent Clp protease ATP-binding subunit ClpC